MNVSFSKDSKSVLERFWLQLKALILLLSGVLLFFRTLNPESVNLAAPGFAQTPQVCLWPCSTSFTHLPSITFPLQVSIFPNNEHLFIQTILFDSSYQENPLLCSTTPILFSFHSPSALQNLKKKKNSNRTNT